MLIIILIKDPAFKEVLSLATEVVKKWGSRETPMASFLVRWKETEDTMKGNRKL